jgi:hypothetical protein
MRFKGLVLRWRQARMQARGQGASSFEINLLAALQQAGTVRSVSLLDDRGEQTMQRSLSPRRHN